MIDPYEQTLKAMKAGERQEWAQRVVSELRSRFVVLAGMQYRENVVI